MADPDFVFIDGFDKYGPVNTNGEQFIRAISVSNEWSGFGSNTTWDANFRAGAPIGTTGGASFQIADNDAILTNVNIFKNLPANYARAVGGIYYKSTGINYIYQIASFYDTVGAATQLYIGVDTAGKLGVWRGNYPGTRIATGTYVYATGTSVGIEWDVTFSNTTGVVKVWVEGVLDINLTAQDTTSTANDYFNRIYIGQFAPAGGGSLVATINYDHFYLWCYTAAGGTESPLGAGFQVQTSFASADSTPSQFNSRRYIGNYSLTTAGGTNTATNIAITGPFTIPENCQGLGIVFWPDDAVVSTNTTYVGVYAASGGAPTTLLAQVSTSNTTASQATGLYFDTPISLTAGSQIFLAYTTNLSTGSQYRSGTASVPTYNVTRATFGPLPSTSLPLGTSVLGTQQAIGLIASGTTASKFETMDMNPPLSAYIYNFDSTVGDVDAYTFGAFEGTPASISYVALKAALSRTNTGSRTTQIEADSAGTISAGTLPAFTPSLFDGPQNGGPIYGTYFKNDPATSAAWTNSAAVAVKGRVKVVS